MYQKTLSTGTLTVTPRAGAWELDALFDIAERNNPKRSFLFVSKVLGRHIPVRPAVMRSVYVDLACRLPADLTGPVVFIGMAETAVGLAAGVFQEARKWLPESVLLTTTRHPAAKGRLLCGFQESHSHATDHLVYWPADEENAQLFQRAETLVLIDDEATTGNTFANLLSAVAERGHNQFRRVITVTLTDWSDNALSTRTDLPVQPIALAFGDWHWQARPDAPIPVMPDVNVTATGSVKISSRQSWGRLGMTDAVDDLGADLVAAPGERILILGSSEFIWLPFLLAERLARQGAEAYFSSITRSPIAQGHAIESIMAFRDNYGLGIPNFLYNVIHQRWDRIIIGCETPAASIDPAFLDQLRTVAQRVEVVAYD